MDSGAALERLVVAALVGFLIGLDRERAETRKARPLFAGIRTFPMVALAGAVPMLLLDQIGPWLLIATFLIVGGVVLTSYWRSASSGNIGATTEIAALATFLLGTLAGSGQLIVAAATGVAIAALLVAKPRLEGFSRALSAEELAGALELAVVAVIVLPLAPNRGFGPWGAWNPFDIWFVVVLVHGLSFAGFIAMRLLGGRRGLLASGVIGALASSTAVTVAMASHSKRDESLGAAAAASAVLASVIMGIRVLLLTAAIHPGIVPRLAPVVFSMSATGAFTAWMIGRRASLGPAETAQITSPFRLTPALAFGAIYAAVSLAVPAAQFYMGTMGVYAAAAVSSLADVDAVAIAFTRMGPGDSAWRVGALAISIGLVVNTLVKLGIAVTLGAGIFRRYVAMALLAMALAGAANGWWLSVG